MSEGDDRFYIDVDALQDQGISAQDIKKLKDGGYATIRAVMSASKKHLTAIKGLSEVKVDKIKDGASKLSGPLFKTASDVLLDREKVLFVTTGSKSLDAMLGGGVQTQSITEVYGEYRCGKTQICHTLCVTTQLPVDMGGGGGKVAFIDTEGTFRPDRVRAVADRFGLDANAVMDNIIVGRAANSEHQMDLIVYLAAEFAADGSFRLLIVDSILALFRVDYSGRGELSERQQRLNLMLARLTRISEEFNVAIFITNQVQSDPGASSIFAGDKKAVGGHVLAHASTTRVYLRKGRQEERVAKLHDSPDMPEAEASYKITAGGIDDC